MYKQIGPSIGSCLIALVGILCLIATMQQYVAGRATAALALAESVVQKSPVQVATQYQADDTICATLSAITREECLALLVLYKQTNGEQWKDRTNWLRRTSALSPCDWYGVRCAGGHVTRLLLASNYLSGTLPARIGNFDFLTHLQLTDNQLRGPIPLELCELVDTVQLASVSYNQLFANNDRAAQCLNRVQPNWQESQTIAPRDLRTTAISTDTIKLSWEPIPYTADGGYYEISYAPVITANNISTYTVHGITTDKAASGYTLNGLTPGQGYRIRVRTHTPANANQENAQWSNSVGTAATTQAAGDPLLALIYFPADNDLSPYVASVVRRVQLGTRANPNVRAIMLVDARGDHNTVVLDIANGEINHTNAVVEAWGKDELDTTDPAVLTWFLQTARTRYTAARTVVSLIGHGSGMTPEVEGEPVGNERPGAVDTKGIPALPKTIPAMPGDFENGGGYLSTADFAQALAAATDNGTNPFDVVFFDQCFQGNLDVLYEFHNYARAFVASPNYAWLAAPYHKYLVDFAPTDTPEELAETIIVHYQDSLTNAQPNVIFWVRGDDIPPIASAVSNLGDALQQAVNDGAEELITQAAQASQYIDTTQCGRGNLYLGQPDELLGAGSFARNLMRAFSSVDNTANGNAIHNAASTLLTELQQVHSLARTGRPYIAPDQYWNYEDSLTIVAPLARRTMSHREMLQAGVWRASIYHDAAPLTVVLANRPTQTATVTSAFAFTQQGRWDDFINGWYTTPLTPTVGTRCYYMPPAIVRSPITETLALTLTTTSVPGDTPGETNDAVIIDWTATNARQAAGYWLFVRPADTVRWLVLESLPITQTTYLVEKPKPGIPYEFVVVAQDELGTTVAESNQIRYAAVPEPVDNRLYLPFVVK